MREKALKEVHLYLQNADNSIRQQAAAIQNDGIEVVVHCLKTQKDINLPEREQTRAGVRMDCACRKAAEGINCSGTGILIVTDCSRMAEELAAQGVPVLGVLTQDNKEDGFLGVQYLCGGADSLEAEYLERVYRRYKELPWHILETDRCIVRETTEEDVEAFYGIYAEPSVTAHMENLFEDKEEEIRYTRQYRKCVYEFLGFGIWTVLWKETGEVIGRIGITMREGYDIPELGFLVGVPWQKKGVATEVCEAVLQFGEEELGFSALQALVEPENTVSVHLLKKLGFVCQGECMHRGETFQYFLRETDSGRDN